MTEFTQQLINGLALGSILALIALGYTMVYGILRFINFAHGDIFMLGAFAGFYLAPKVATVLPTPSIWSGLAVMGISMAICAVIGIVIERLAYRPLRRSPKLTVLITAIGVSLFLGIHRPVCFRRGPEKISRDHSGLSRRTTGRPEPHEQPDHCLCRDRVFAARAAFHCVKNENRHGDARAVLQSRSRRAHGRSTPMSSSPSRSGSARRWRLRQGFCSPSIIRPLTRSWGFCPA